MQKEIRPKADPDRLPPMDPCHHKHFVVTQTAEPKLTQQPDRVNHPSHYTSHPSGVECITITEHYDFCVGNAIKYLWRCGLKVEEGVTPKDKEIEDLKKAVYYINRKIKNLEK